MLDERFGYYGYYGYYGYDSLRPGWASIAPRRLWGWSGWVETNIAHLSQQQRHIVLTVTGNSDYTDEYRLVWVYVCCTTESGFSSGSGSA